VTRALSFGSFSSRVQENERLKKYSFTGKLVVAGIFAIAITQALGFLLLFSTSLTAHQL